MVCQKLPKRPTGGSFADRDEALLPLFGNRRYPATRRWRILFGEEPGEWPSRPRDEPIPIRREVRRLSSDS